MTECCSFCWYVKCSFCKFFEVVKSFKRTKWKIVLLKCLKYLEREGELIQGISFIVVEGKMKKVARIEALGTFY